VTLTPQTMIGWREGYDLGSPRASLDSDYGLRVPAPSLYPHARQTALPTGSNMYVEEIPETARQRRRTSTFCTANQLVPCYPAFSTPSEYPPECASQALHSIRVIRKSPKQHRIAIEVTSIRVSWRVPVIEDAPTEMKSGESGRGGGEEMIENESRRIQI